MSREVDQRVVEMRFDNENFEKNAQQSLSTLQKLQNALSFKGAKDGLKDIDNATKSVNMHGLAVGVETVSSKFSALEVIGITALANITNSAVNAGKSLVKSLSIDQVTAGWTKYADKTSAVQTIMAATANAFDDVEVQMEAVNEQLDKLSWFTDETSYNFVDMVSNIGKFTSNNIGLEDAVTSMEGIATWAAISGANATQASHAMYNLSQAIGAGAVTKKDWFSIETANMATAEFKQTVIDIAVEMKKLKKVGDGTYETLKGNAFTVASFGNELADKWFDNEVLTAALKKYGEFTTKLNDAFNETGKLTSDLLSDIDAYKDGSIDLEKAIKGSTVTSERYGEILKELGDSSLDFGRKAFAAAQETKTFAEVIAYTKDAVSSQWMGIFEIMFGDYTTAKKLWTNMSNDFYTLFVEPLEEAKELISDAFNSTALQLFHKRLVDQSDTMDGLMDSLAEGYKVSLLMAPAFLKAHEELNDLDEDTAKLVAHLQKPTGRELFINTIQNSFQIIIKAIDIVKNAWHEVFPVTTAEKIYHFIEVIHDFTENTLTKLDKNSENIGKTLKSIFSILDLIIRGIKGGFSFALGLINKGLSLFGTNIWDITFKLSDLILKFHDFILNTTFFSDAFNSILNVFKNVFAVIQNFIKQLKLTKKASSAFLSIKKNSKRALDVLLEYSKPAKIMDGLRKAISSLEKTFSKLKKTVIKWFPNLPGILKTIYDWVSKLVVKVSDFIKQTGLLKTAQTVLQTFGRIGRNVFERFLSILKGIGSYINEFIGHWKQLDHLDLSTVIQMLKDFKMTVIDSILDPSVIADKVRSFGKVFTDSLGNMSIKADISGAPFISSIFDTLKKVFKKFFDKFSTEDAIATLITAIDLLFVRKLMKTLTSFTNMTDTFSKLGDTIAGTFKGITGVLSGFAAIGNSVSGTFGSITKYFKALTRAVNVKTIMYIAIAMGILTASLIALAYVPYPKLDDAVKIIYRLAIVLGGLAIAVGLMNRLSVGASGMTFSSSVGLIGVVAAIAILAKVINELSKLTPEEIKKGIITVGALALLMLAFVAAYQLVGKWITALTAVSGTGLLGLFGLIGVAYAMRLLIENIAILQEKLDGITVEKIKDQLIAIAVAFGEIFIASLPFVFGGFKAGLGMLAAVASLYLIVRAIQKIAEIDTKTITDNLKAFGIVFGMLLGLMIISQTAGKYAAEGGSGVLKMAIALAVLVLAIKMIGDMPSNQLGKAVTAISILLIVMGLIVKLSQHAGKNAAKAGAMLIMMSIAIGILVACVYMLTWLAKDKDKLYTALDAIIVFGIIMALFVGMSEYAGSAKGALAAIAIMTVFIAVLAGALYMLGKIENANSMLIASIAMGIVMVLSAVLLAVAGSINISAKALASIGVMVLVIAALAGILYLMSVLEVQNALSNAAALSILLVSISLAMLILSKIGPMAEGSIASIAKLSLVFIVLTGILIAIGNLLSHIDGAKEFIERGIPMIELIGEALGSLVGGILKGIAGGGLEDLSKSFINVCDNIKTAIGKITPIIKDISGIEDKDGLFKGIEAISGLILAFGKTELKDAIASLINGNDVSSFADKIKSFVKMAIDFPVISDARVRSMKRVAEAGKALAEFADAIPNEGGVLGFFVGNNDDLTKFGNEMANFANSIIGIKPINDDQVENIKRVATAGKYLTEFAGTMANEGGALAGLIGDNEKIGLFGSRCRVFAERLSQFAPVNQTHVETAKRVSEAGEYLAAFAKKIGNVTVSDYDTWGVSALGLYARTFADELAQFPTSITDDHSAAVSLVANSIESFSRIADVVTEHKNSYANAVADNSFANFITAINESIPNFRELGFVLKAANFGSIGEQIDSFSEMLQKLLDILSSITGSEGAMLSQLTTSFIEFGKKGISAFAEGLTIADDGIIVMAVENMVSAAVKAINGKADEFYKSGDTLVFKLKEGIVNYNTQDFIHSFTNKIEMALARIRLYREGYYSAGTYLISGYILGITAKAQEVYQAAYNVGQKAHQGLMDGQKSQSPSKLAEQAGLYFGEGYINGISECFNAAASTGEYLAKNTLTTMATTLSDVGSLVNENLEVQPTISPVINRAAISEELNSIGSMFSGSKAGLLSTQISGKMDANNVVLDYISKLDSANATRNKDVLGAFNKLSDDILSLGDRIENLELRLDSNKLVGGIAEKTDRAMGMRTMYERRNI